MKSLLRLAFLLGTLTTASFASAGHLHNDVRADRKEVATDKKNQNKDTHDLIKQERQLARDQKHGDATDVKKDKANIAIDKKYIVKDSVDLVKDRADLRRDDKRLAAHD